MTTLYPSQADMQKLIQRICKSPSITGDELSMILEYIRTLEKEHRAMREELELIGDGHGVWTGAVLSSLTLKP